MLTPRHREAFSELPEANFAQELCRDHLMHYNCGRGDCEAQLTGASNRQSIYYNAQRAGARGSLCRPRRPPRQPSEVLLGLSCGLRQTPGTQLLLPVGLRHPAAPPAQRTNSLRKLLTRQQRLVGLFLLLDCALNEDVAQSPFAVMLFWLFDRSSEPFERMLLHDVLVLDQRDKVSVDLLYLVRGSTPSPPP